MYREGQGCKKNPKMAIYWYEKCLKSLEAHPDNDSGLSVYSIRNIIAKLRSEEGSAPKPEVKAEPKKVPTTEQPKAAEPKPAPKPPVTRTKSAEELNAEGMACLEKDPAGALRLFEQAGEMGYASAQYNYGMIHRRGQGCKQDDKKALEWLEKAAAQKHLNAQYMCGQMYYLGLGCEQNYEKALEWFKEAATQGDANAQYKCAITLYEMELIYLKKHDFQQMQVCTSAREYWYKKAASQGHVDAQIDLGKHYYAKSDTGNARYWFEKAAAQGNEDAKFWLEHLD